MKKSTFVVQVQHQQFAAFGYVQLGHGTFPQIFDLFAIPVHGLTNLPTEVHRDQGVHAAQVMFKNILSVRVSPPSLPCCLNQVGHNHDDHKLDEDKSDIIEENTTIIHGVIISAGCGYGYIVNYNKIRQ